MSTMNDAFEKETLQPLDVAITSVVRQTTHLIADARHLRKMLEAAQTSAQALPVESERERHGRLLFKANASLLMYNCPVWETQIRQVQEEYCESAERYNKSADLVSLAEVRSEITMLDEGSSKDNDDFAWGCRDACHAMSNVLRKRFG